MIRIYWETKGDLACMKCFYCMDSFMFFILFIIAVITKLISDNKNKLKDNFKFVLIIE